LLLPVTAAVDDTASWVGTTNADIDFQFFEPGPVKHDATILAFTATPKDETADMYVNPKSALQIPLSETGTVGLNLEVSDLLRMLHHHVRHTVIGMWFDYGFMPKTYAELQALQQAQ
jgi:hypothetical protein